MKVASICDKVNWVSFILVVIVVVLVNNGISALQVFFIAVLLILFSVYRNFDARIASKITLAFSVDLPAPTMTRLHSVSLYASSPVIIVSNFSTSISAILLFVMILIFYSPIFKLISSKKAAEKIRGLALDKLSASGIDVAFYVSGPSNSGYQINQWIPIADRMNSKTAICVRKLYLVDEVDNTSVPIVFARTAADLESIVRLANVKVFLYPANPVEVATALRHTEVRHLFINHGESDKVVNQSKMLMAYDKLLLSGPAAKRRLRAAGLPLRKGQVEYVGRPQLELFLQPAPAPSKIKKILYAPTWEGFVDDADYSSVSKFGIAILEELVKDKEKEVIVKFHPFTGRRKKSVQASFKHIRSMAEVHPNLSVLDHKEPLYPLMNWCDVMIADIGSVIADFLATEKPIIVTLPPRLQGIDLHGEFPTTRAAYIVDDSAEIMERIDKIEVNDEKISIRKKVRKETLGDFSDDCLIRFENVIRSDL